MTPHEHLQAQVPEGYRRPRCPRCHRVMPFIHVKAKIGGGWQYACLPCDLGITDPAIAKPVDEVPDRATISAAEASWISRHAYSTPESRAVTAQSPLGLEVPEPYVDTLARTLYEANGLQNVNGGTTAEYDILHWSVQAHIRRQVIAVAGQLLGDLANALTDDTYDDICIWAGENGLKVVTS